MFRRRRWRRIGLDHWLLVGADADVLIERQGGDYRLQVRRPVEFRDFPSLEAAMGAAERETG